ncbi:alanine racemase [Streptomyces sp. S1D4-11]
MLEQLPEGLVTPALVVDADVLDRNIARMAEAARTGGFALRPHAKSHKCAEIAGRQLRAGARGLSVATLSEAEAFAAAGVDDLFIAYPLWPDEGRARRLRRLADVVALRVGVDSVEAARRLGDAVRGSDRPVEVLVEVDCGTARTGVLKPRTRDRWPAPRRTPGWACSARSPSPDTDTAMTPRPGSGRPATRNGPCPRRRRPYVNWAWNPGC